MLILAACSDEPAATTTESAGLEDCPALATWQQAQQRYLAILADVPIDEYEQPSTDVLDAGLALGSVLLEAVREATQAGCEEALVVGTPTLCERIAGLSAEGEAAESHLESLRRDCA